MQILPPASYGVLRSEYLRRVQRNSLYSLRAFARDLGVSHSHLSRVLHGQKRLSLQQANCVAESLSLQAAEKDSFLLAVAQEWTRPKAVRVDPPNQQARLPLPLVLDAENFRMISEWHHVAILELLTLEDFPGTASAAAKRLGIPLAQVKTGLAQLKRLGLVEQRGTRWHRPKGSIAVPSQRSDAAIRAFHRSMIEKALVALENDISGSPESRDVSGTTFAVDLSRIPEAKQRIFRFRQNLMRYLSGGKRTRLFQLNVQLFSLEAGKEQP